MLPSYPLWFLSLAFKPLLSISTSHPLISIQTSTPPGVWSCYLAPPNSHPALPSPWQLYSSTLRSASDSQFSKVWLWKQDSNFPFFSELASHSNNTFFFHDRNAHLHYPQAAAEWDFILSLPSQLKQFSLPASSCSYSLRQLRHPACSISITFTYY